MKKIKGLPTKEIRKDAKPCFQGVSAKEFDSYTPRQKRFILRWNKTEKK